MLYNNLDGEIDRIILWLSNLDPTSEEYRAGAESLRLMTEARSKKRFPIEPEILATGVFQLVSILLVLNHERFMSIGSKSLMFIKR